jgi:hypothetical protein
LAVTVYTSQGWKKIKNWLLTKNISYVVWCLKLEISFNVSLQLNINIKWVSHSQSPEFKYIYYTNLNRSFRNVIFLSKCTTTWAPRLYWNMTPYGGKISFKIHTDTHKPGCCIHTKVYIHSLYEYSIYLPEPFSNLVLQIIITTPWNSHKLFIPFIVSVAQERSPKQEYSFHTTVLLANAVVCKFTQFTVFVRTVQWPRGIVRRLDVTHF